MTLFCGRWQQFVVVSLTSILFAIIYSINTCDVSKSPPLCVSPSRHLSHFEKYLGQKARVGLSGYFCRSKYLNRNIF
jgi:hypothetical protein